MIMCQPIVMMFILSFQTELTSTMGPGSRNRRTFETGKSVLSYVFTPCPASVRRRPVSPSRPLHSFEAAYRVFVVDSRALRPRAAGAPGELGQSDEIVGDHGRPCGVRKLKRVAR